MDLLKKNRNLIPLLLCKINKQLCCFVALLLLYEGLSTKFLSCLIINMAKVTRYRCWGGVILFVWFAIPLFTNAQNNYLLQINYVDSNISNARDNAAIQTQFNSKAECDGYIVKLIANLQAKGFIAASLDSIYHTQNQGVIQIFLGQQYQTLQLTIRPQDLLVMQDVLPKYKLQQVNSISFAAYPDIGEKLLDYFEERGYPFAKINLDSLQIIDNKILATLQIDKGYPYRIDSIRLFGKAKISTNFIHRYLNIERGSLYSKKKLNKINQRLLELPYLQQSNQWDITMLNTGSIVNLYLQPRRSNQVNVLAGFLPANQQLGGKLLFTIDANLKLQNAFSNGESLGLVWQQIQPKSPRLNLQFTQPYMFNSPFGIDFLFDLLKKDSAFLNINGQLGLLYMLSPTQTGKIIIQSQRTNILDTDTSSVKFTKRLPNVADVSSVNLGVDYELNNTDYKFNPRSGVEIYFSALAGNKTIKKNNAIVQIKDPSFNYANLYDSVKLKTYQFRLKLKTSKYFKTGKQTVLKTAVNAGLYQSPQFYNNDLFQIGGYKTLRGFDEESIYTNQYFIGTIEYRYILLQNSNFFGFTDFGWSRNDVIRQSNSYLGAGLGISFETKGGIFNLSYAVGKRNDLNFDIKQSKIHFGFVSIF